jgi:hypothetical protein
MAAARAAALSLGLLGLLGPARGSGLEPRFDHRDQQGPTVEVLAVKDVLWHGSTTSTSPVHGVVRVAWGFDPTGDGDEVFLGGTFTAVEGRSPGTDRVRLTLDARYRVCLGTEELKTLIEIGIWGSAADRFAVGPLVGFGLIYDFSRNVGLLTSAFLGAAFGESRIVSYGGGLGVQFRFE